MQDLNTLHRKLCPKKCLGNFFKSADFVAAKQSLGLPEDEVLRRSKAARGHPSQTLVHPVVALAFLRWADPVVFYSRLQRVVEG